MRVKEITDDNFIPSLLDEFDKEFEKQKKEKMKELSSYSKEMKEIVDEWILFLEEGIPLIEEVISLSKNIRNKVNLLKKEIEYHYERQLKLYEKYNKKFWTVNMFKSYLEEFTQLNQITSKLENSNYKINEFIKKEEYRVLDWKEINREIVRLQMKFNDLCKRMEQLSEIGKDLLFSKTSNHFITTKSQYDNLFTKMDEYNEQIKKKESDCIKIGKKTYHIVLKREKGFRSRLERTYNSLNSTEQDQIRDLWLKCVKQTDEQVFEGINLKSN